MTTRIMFQNDNSACDPNALLIRAITKSDTRQIINLHVKTDWILQHNKVVAPSYPLIRPVSKKNVSQRLYETVLQRTEALLYQWSVLQIVYNTP